MKKIEMAKLGLLGLVGVGINNIIEDSVNANKPEKSSALDRVSTKVGVLVLTAMIGSIAINYVEDKFDKVVEHYKKQKMTKEEEIK